MAAAALLILPTLAAPSTALDAFLYSPLFGPLLPVGANPSLQWQGVRVDPKDVCANNARLRPRLRGSCSSTRARCRAIARPTSST